MDAAEILKMVEDTLLDICFIIDAIISGDDITMQAVLKHPSIGAQGQVLESSKVKLFEEISVISFLAYPFHRVKVVSKHIFSIVNDVKAQRCGCTKSDALRLKKYWGYMIKKNIIKILEELRQTIKFYIEHMFKNHGECSV